MLPSWNAAGEERRYLKQTLMDSATPSGSVQMLHKPNPYADAPSLYDLYVQASSAPGPAERFGLAAFRRGMANTGALPMHLPVGPEYVVGPGDGLSIDLWGGISQRLLRTVDREGRLALPEAGPLLVSGKSLAEVQQSVQRVLRTQFRDVSADVSLLRLRTVRVYVARKGYFVATPDRHFPIDPHILLPFYQFLSPNWQRRICGFSLGYLRRYEPLDLVSGHTLAALFPQATVQKLGLPMSPTT
jgi:hypothetical protein